MQNLLLELNRVTEPIQCSLRLLVPRLASIRPIQLRTLLYCVIFSCQVNKRSWYPLENNQK
uniref:Uncharacterized protein n=1 Tax=Anguilla anguilla TaxID=7936 RepID=A0A0E9XT14_ANGAN